MTSPWTGAPAAPHRGRRRAAIARRHRRTARRPPTGSSLNAVSRAKSPCSRRTTRPPRRSIAGRISNPLASVIHHASVLARYYANTRRARRRTATMADDWRTPDAEALFEAILRLEDARRGRALLSRPLHAQRAARHGPALGRRPPARQRPALRRDLARDRRQHGHHHPHRLVAEPRRGRLPGDARHSSARQADAYPSGER